MILSKPSRRLPIPDKGEFLNKLKTTGPPPTGRDSNETWEAIKTWIVQGVNETRNTEPTKKKHWMTERTTDLEEISKSLIKKFKGHVGTTKINTLQEYAKS